MDLKINLKSVLLPALLTMVLLGGCSAQLATFGLATFGDDLSQRVLQNQCKKNKAKKD